MSPKHVLRSKSKKIKMGVKGLAIYHMTTKPISRSSGRSATASSAYRNACVIKDERTGLEHNYSKKQGVLFSKAFDKNKIEIDRNDLWNLAESSEKRKDARTAREYIIAIPFELIPENDNDKKDFNKNLGAKVAFEFAEQIAKKLGVAVDVAIHAPDKEGSNKNYHAHIMTTTRKFERTESGIALTDKSNIELSNKKLNELNLPKTQQQVKSLRQLWADTANKYLDNKNKIDHRSYAEQNKDQLPTIKLGWKASEMERRGIKTERGDINRAIIADNKKIIELKSDVNHLQIEQLKQSELDKRHIAEVKRLVKAEFEQKRKAEIKQQQQAEKRLAEIEQQRKVEIEKQRQAEIEQQRQVELEKSMVDIEVPATKKDLEIERIENRKTVDLLNLKLQITVKDKDTRYVKGTLYTQDEVSISHTYYKYLKHAEKNDRDFIVKDASKHLNNNQTALNIKRFLYDGITEDTQTTVDKINDYHNLSIKDFVETYNIAYSAEDLKNLDSRNPEPMLNDKKEVEHTAENANEQNYNNDFRP